MPLKIYNTLTRKKDEFIPLQEGKVTMYCCGITAYDFSHIGHTRAAVVFDVIYRYLKYRGYAVTYVRNYTDIDDKIINRANKEGVSCEEIAEKYIREYEEDMELLRMEKPTFTPRATAHIQEMIRLIEQLFARGYAYTSSGDVFYSVSKFKEYGKLSGKNLEELKSGARVEVDERKTDPLDFVLWKASKQGEPAWDSTWGKGRPGWHIECSAMSQKYLGESFDIHGGGQDLIFPHHENEIAQSEGATGKPFARYWIHNGFVNINQEKMSKSLGNFLSNREILSHYHPEVVRIFLLSNHYRSPVDFSDQNLEEAKSHLERFYALLKDLKDLKRDGQDSASMNPQEREIQKIISELPDKFHEAMDDDFNTASALGHLNFCLRNLNGWVNQVKKEGEKQIPLALVNEATETFSKIGQVLGLFQDHPDHYFDRQKTEKLRALDITEGEIARLIEERNQARRKKNWTKADEIRNLLLAKSIILEDTPQGTIWKVK
jgi:cysteinyl-tRNA synthetase